MQGQRPRRRCDGPAAHAAGRLEEVAIWIASVIKHRDAAARLI